MPTKRLTDVDLERIRIEAEEISTVKRGEKATNWGFVVSKGAGVLSSDTKNFKEHFQKRCRRLEEYFEATNNSDASYRQKQLLTNFRYYNDLMFTAWDFFENHYLNNKGFFSSDIYEQWLEAMKLGLYQAPEYVLSREGLNYPDQVEPSKRLRAVEKYMRCIYLKRLWVEVFSDSLTSGTSSKSRIVSMSPERWQEHTNQTRQSLNDKLGYYKAQKVFQEVYGGDNPPPPSNRAEADQQQKNLLDKLVGELLLKHNSEKKEEFETTKPPQFNSPPLSPNDNSNNNPPLISDNKPNFEKYYQRIQKEEKEKETKLTQILKELREKNLPNCSSLTETSENYFNNSQEEKIQNAVLENIKKHKSEWTIQEIPTIYGYSQTKEKMLIHQSANCKYDKEGYLEKKSQLIQPIKNFSDKQQTEVESLLKNANRGLEVKDKNNWWYFLLIIPLFLGIYIFKKLKIWG